MTRRLAPGLVLFLITLCPAPAGALTVRSDRPRLLFGNGSYPALAFAAAYLATGTASHCASAVTSLQSLAADTPGQPDPHSFISNNGHIMIQLAIVRDWCDPALDSAQKQQLESLITQWADWYLANDPGDVYHDDMPNVWSSIAEAGLALRGTAQDAKAQTYLAAAETKWKNVILPAMAYEGDWWHAGFTYVQPSLGGLAWFAATWSTATDDDIYAWAKQNAGDLLEGYLLFHAYAMRPDYKYVYFGDTSDNKQSIELFSRPLVDLLNYGLGSPLGQALSMEIRDSSRAYYDYSGADGYLIALLYDVSKESSAKPRSQLPVARHLSPGAQDVAILRSGWSKDDTFVWMSCGDYFGAHQRMESGSFQIFRKGILTGSTGYYDNFDSDHWVNYYSQHSVHGNVLSIYQPGEIFPNSKTLSGGANVNDGGQRPLRRDKNGNGYASPDLKTYLANKSSGTQYETGDLKAFALRTCHQYVACDVTAAYNSPGHATNGNPPKVSEVTRQLVFLPPQLVVVFDRVEATDASYARRFLLHAPLPGNAPSVGASQTFTITSGNGRLVGRTLLPAAADLKLVQGFTVESTPHPPSTAGDESGGARLEISPQKEAARDYFLHLLYATEPTVSAPPAATITEDAASATVSLDEGGRHYVLRFAKTGAMGGHLTVTGAQSCDEELVGSVTPTDGASLAGDGGLKGDRGGSTVDGFLHDDPGPPSKSGKSGCSCSTDPGSAAGLLAPALLVLAAALLLARRLRCRRRSATQSPHS